MTRRPPKRGEIYWVCLDPTVGSETKKTRPGVILSNNTANIHSNRVIVAPITSSIDRVYPFEAKIEMAQGTKKVMLDQIRSVDKRRLRGKKGSVSLVEMADIERALKLSLALS